MERPNARVNLEKDNDLLRAQIADMSNAQEPLREEKYYVFEFRQIGMDIEFWAAKRLRTMPTKSLSNTDSRVIVSELRNCGEYGETASKWFDGKDIKQFKERRNLIVMIRHVVAVVLYDRVFAQFIFGFSRRTSVYFDEVEKRICLNGFRHVYRGLTSRKLLLCKYLKDSTSNRTSGH